MLAIATEALQKLLKLAPPISERYKRIFLNDIIKFVHSIGFKCK